MATTKKSTRRTAASGAASQRRKRAPGPVSSTLGGVADSVQQVWLAGLGALGRAQSEGTRLFESLASEGREVQDRALNRAGERADALLETIESRTAAARERTSATVQWVERAVDERLQALLRRLDIPTREELEALERRIDGLAARPAPKPRTRAPRPHPVEPLHGERHEPPAAAPPEG
ncbi:phasin family protein [Xanthomonas massiliensis]|jgi:poly(hydroxyalkanoate) granule-associated protein|uniref:phasin family protein n=1 Tax=Xanthomonas massiliensis TaxID=1720302 RepID=UPI000825E80F|nr:phasin family protein [Xanthomonas massiliensis]